MEKVAALVHGRLCCLLCVRVTSSTLHCPAHGGGSPSRPGKLPGEVWEGLLQPNHVRLFHDASHSTASASHLPSRDNGSTCFRGIWWGLTRQAQPQEALMKVPLISAVTVALTDNIYCIDLHSFFVKLASLNRPSVIRLSRFYTKIGQFTWRPSPQSLNVPLI